MLSQIQVRLIAAVKATFNAGMVGPVVISAPRAGAVVRCTPRVIAIVVPPGSGGCMPPVRHLLEPRPRISTAETDFFVGRTVRVGSIAVAGVGFPLRADDACSRGSGGPQ